MATTVPAMAAGQARGGRTVPRPPKAPEGMDPTAPPPPNAPPPSTFRAQRQVPRPPALAPTYASNGNPATLDPGGKQGLANYGGMVGATADAIHSLDGFQV